MADKKKQVKKETAEKSANPELKFADIGPSELLRAGVAFIIDHTRDDEWREEEWVIASAGMGSVYDSTPLENVLFFDGYRGLTKIAIREDSGKSFTFDKTEYHPKGRQNDDSTSISSNVKILNAAIALQSVIGEIKATTKPVRTLFIMRDIDPDLRGPGFQNVLKRFVEDQALDDKLTVVLLAYSEDVPKELREYAVLTNAAYMPKPKVQKLIQESQIKSIRENSEMYAERMKGMSIKEIVNNFCIISITADNLENRLRLVDEMKKANKETPFLNMKRPENGLDVIGGNDILKDKLSKYSYVYRHWQEAAKLGIQGVRGILLVGLPGTGKSVMAEAFAYELGLPYVNLKLGAIYGKYLGESEKNLSTALEFAESLGCVLQIDEIDKEVGNDQNATNATESRIVGALLTRMAQMKNVVFVGTANNILNLPEALLRKGRFDQIFWVDLPSPEEREAIYSIHFKKNAVEGSIITSGLKKAVQLTEGWTGAEIEYSILEGKRIGFAENEGKKALTSDVLYDIIQKEIPQSVAFAEQANKAREKLATIATSASSVSQFAKVQKKVLSNAKKQAQAARMMRGESA